MTLQRITSSPWAAFALGALLACAAYLPGVHGQWLFDDFPNIVDNPGVRMQHLALADLARAAFASPASDFKRPLASLSFAINYYAAGGYDPAAMKATNLAIHLFNGLIVFLLFRAVLRSASRPDERRDGFIAAMVATAWLLLPINLTAVLYVVQRMESLANLAVLLGLWGYVTGRQRMRKGMRGKALAFGSVVAGVVVGALAKETAILLPLYAAIVEWFMFRGPAGSEGGGKRDAFVVPFFVAVLVVPFVAGTAWLVPKLADPASWATRDFTLGTRLLSEARIVIDYVTWTLLPDPRALSFYHDDFEVSQGWLTPMSTVACVIAIAGLLLAGPALRKRAPLTGLGISLFLACQSLTATVIPLELIYEHRNYFASLGLLIALAGGARAVLLRDAAKTRRVLVVAASALIAAWGLATWTSARAWGDPLRLAQALASRAPKSPRAQYELGRAYIIYSHYDRQSPFTPLAYAPLEASAALPGASILPEQALIFFNSRLGLPVKQAWWDSMEAKLRRRPATVQDESSLDALSTCLASEDCAFDPRPLLDAYLAALSHDSPTPRLTSMYANFAWRTLGDQALAIQSAREAVRLAPHDPTYRMNLARYAMAMQLPDEVARQAAALKSLNAGGRVQPDIDTLAAWLAKQPRGCGGVSCQGP